MAVLSHSTQSTVRNGLTVPYAGDALLSKAVNAAIGFKPLYALMKVGAKQVYKGTAERNGVPWDATVRQLQATPQACTLPVLLCTASLHMLPVALMQQRKEAHILPCRCLP